MAVLETLGIIVALGVLALMALAPALVTLNDRYPVRARPAHRPVLSPADARRAMPAQRPILLERRTPAHTN